MLYIFAMFFSRIRRTFCEQRTEMYTVCRKTQTTNHWMWRQPLRPYAELSPEHTVSAVNITRREWLLWPRALSSSRDVQSQKRVEGQKRVRFVWTLAFCVPPKLPRNATALAHAIIESNRLRNTRTHTHYTRLTSRNHARSSTEADPVYDRVHRTKNATRIHTHTATCHIGALVWPSCAIL